MLTYFDGLSAAAAAGTMLDDARLGELAIAAHMRVLGPVPEGYA